MKLSTTTFWQMIVWIGAVMDLALHTSPIPDNARPWVALAAGAVSLALHQHAGRRNPDGSDAKTPYDPLVKE